MSAMNRILVMDANAHDCSFLKEYLGQFGYRVDCAADEETAIDFLSYRSYDGLLLETVHGPQTESRVLTWLKDHGRTEPVIMMSEWADYEMWIDLVNQGAIDLLSKPVQTQQLKQALHKAIYGQLLLYATCNSNHSNLPQAINF